MITFVDLRATRERSADHAELRAYLQQLVGQPFLFISFSYGDELTLHFGQTQSYDSPKLSHLRRGSYVIAARASSWFLSSQTSPSLVIGTEEPLSFSSQEAQPLAPQDLEAREVIKAGVRIVAVDAIRLKTSAKASYAFGLSMSLQDGTSAFVLPLPDSDNDVVSGVADWEIFTPYDRFLTVGPELRWSYLDSTSERS